MSIAAATSPVAGRGYEEAGKATIAGSVSLATGYESETGKVAAVNGRVEYPVQPGTGLAVEAQTAIESTLQVPGARGLSSEVESRTGSSQGLPKAEAQTSGTWGIGTDSITGISEAQSANSKEEFLETATAIEIPSLTIASVSTEPYRIDTAQIPQSEKAQSGLFVYKILPKQETVFVSTLPDFEASNNIGNINSGLIGQPLRGAGEPAAKQEQIPVEQQPLSTPPQPLTNPTPESKTATKTENSGTGNRIYTINTLPADLPQGTQALPAQSAERLSAVNEVQHLHETGAIKRVDSPGISGATDPAQGQVVAVDSGAQTESNAVTGLKVQVKTNARGAGAGSGYGIGGVGIAGSNPSLSNGNSLPERIASPELYQSELLIEENLNQPQT
ncbi:MAG: hypothetical protein ACYSSL_05640, partial [Planctomycetota bacterium]